MRLIMVSGLAGAGKSVALNMLEDLGYYSIDNLPLGLLHGMPAATLRRQGLDFEKLAIGVDSRASTHDIEQFGQRVDNLRQGGINVEIVYLHADQKTILRRFSETRRRHPLSNEQRSLIDAVELDAQLMKPIADKADIHIDTSQLNIHQLRDLIRNRVGDSAADELSILVQSFGFKYGLPPAVDFVFDVRCLPNPHWVPELRPLTGQDQTIVDFLTQHPATHEMQEDIHSFLSRWLPDFAREDRSYVTIAIGCTGGRHRSVYLAEQLARLLGQQYCHVLIRHNELYRGQPT